MITRLRNTETGGNALLYCCLNMRLAQDDLLQIMIVRRRANVAIITYRVVTIQ